MLDCTPGEIIDITEEEEDDVMIVEVHQGDVNKIWTEYAAAF